MHFATIATFGHSGQCLLQKFNFTQKQQSELLEFTFYYLSINDHSNFDNAHIGGRNPLRTGNLACRPRPVNSNARRIGAGSVEILSVFGSAVAAHRS